MNQSIDLFERASRKRLRFTTSKGSISVEDVWQLPLTSGAVNLESLAQSLYKKVQDSSVSFVNKSKRANTDDTLRLNIVKHIIDVKLNEAESAKLRLENKKKRARILEVIEKKEDESLQDQSISLLRAMADTLKE